jgi:Ni,Fe-hydrogenase maturation factor
VDAHIGAIPEPVRVQEVTPAYGFQAVTHHMSPAMLLSLAQAVAGRSPKAWLVSVRANDLNFGLGLSEETEALLPLAAEGIHRIVGGCGAG